MQQLQLIDQSSQLLDDLVNTILSPTLSQAAKLSEIGRILAHFDLPIEAPRVTGKLWNATALGKELGGECASHRQTGQSTQPENHRTRGISP
ncbi:hypothetical protein [Aeromonas hydrophila]|uniref:hypothetical protein n=1 Tax=Aeromonas hydrophila TaxID=644 RepID=UPI0024412B59|nr:hypothetical protein [Aeromonas hydrophila]